ncbi:hypothetical protein [Petroclostridium sp. X23]|uniref:hypothetical protein n=1 Tax=Petroclostridium sp. X23 TaxID=3045146 RepID=UPI0024ACCB80|nr:hypothetical protein [Petroclostridium sp. X23]WHH57195.1 hypothetical protein QKW49_15260 [Petroclostridium sp. X23]
MFTNDIAAREAEALGFLPISVGHNIGRILRQGGIKTDEEGLSDDYEFIFSKKLSREEQSVLDLLPLYASVAGSTRSIV